MATKLEELEATRDAEAAWDAAYAAITAYKAELKITQEEQTE
jgi:hypothetical protein